MISPAPDAWDLLGPLYERIRAADERNDLVARDQLMEQASALAQGTAYQFLVARFIAIMRAAPPPARAATDG